MKILICCLTLLVFGLASAVSACSNTCDTVIKAVNCREQPIPNATLTIKCASGGAERTKTDEHGEARVKVCPADIAHVGLTSNTANGKAVAASCIASPCVVKFCLSGNKEMKSTVPHKG